MIEQLAIFIRWWGNQLASLIPVSIIRFFRVDTYQVRLNLANDKVSLVDASRDKLLQEFELQPAATALPPAVITAIKKLNTARFETVLILDPEDVLFLDLNLPAEAESNMHNILGFEMDRQTPFSIDQVYYDYLVNKDPDDSSRIQVKLAVARRELIQNWLKQINSQGFFPAVVTVASPYKENNSQFSNINLLPEELRPAQPRVLARFNYLLLIMAFILLVGLAATILFKQNTYIDHLTGEINSVTDKVEEVQRLTKQINKLMEHSNRIVESKKQSASIIGILNDLSVMIPDTTWLNRFELHGDRLKLQGESVNASELIGIIEAYEKFSNASFTSPVVRDAKTGRERFQIMANLSVQDDAS